MADQEIRYRIVAQDDMTVTLEKIKSGLDSVANSAKKTGTDTTDAFSGIVDGAMQVAAGLGIAFSVEKILDFVKVLSVDSFEAFVENELAVTRLNSALVSSGNNLKSYSAEFQDVAEKMSQTTFATKEQIIASESLFLQYGVPAKQIPELMSAIGHYANETGKNIQEVSTRVAYAADGMINNLKRVGIPVDLSGITDEMDRVEKIMSTLEEHWPEAMDTISKTSAMKLHQAASAWHELSEEIGKAWDALGGNRAVTGAASAMHEITLGLRNEEASKLELQIHQLEDRISALKRAQEGYQKNAPEFRDAILGMLGDRTLEQATSDTLNKYMLELVSVSKKLKSIKAEHGPISATAPPEMGIGALEIEIHKKEAEIAATEKLRKGFGTESDKKLDTDIEKTELELKEKQGKDFIRNMEEAEDYYYAKKKKKAIQDAEDEKKIKQAEWDTAKNFLQTGQQLADAFGTKNAALRKSFAIANSIVNTSEAVTKALAEVPPPADIPYAASLAAMGAAQIATIMATDPSGGGSVAAVSGGTTGLGSPGSNTNPIQTVAPQSTPNVHITVSGFVGSESQLASELGKVFREAVNDNVNFGLETTSR